MKNPQEEKFSRINLSNKAFQKRVGQVIGGKVILKEAGFEEQDGFLAMNKPDMDRVKEFLHEINSILEKLN